MKFSCLQSELNHHLSLVSRAVPARPSRPVLGNVLVIADVKQQTVTLVAFDEVLGIESRFSAKVETSGILTVPAKLWGDIVSRLPQDVVHIKTDTDEITVSMTSSSGRYKLRGLSAEDYPALPPIEEDVVSLSAESLLNGLEGSLFATSKDETKQVLTGVHFRSDVDTLKFAATDGHRLAIAQTAITTNNFITEMDMTVPAKALRDVGHILKSSAFTGMVQMHWDDTRVLFEMGTQKLITRLLEGQYPNYRDIFPKKLPHQIILDRNELIKGLNRVAVLTNSKNEIVKLSLSSSAQQLTLSAEVKGEGKGREILSAQIGSDDLEIAFNSRYLLDGLKSFSSQQVLMRCYAATSPVMFTPLGESNVTYLVMPVQTRNGEPEDFENEESEDIENKEPEDIKIEESENIKTEELEYPILDDSDWLELINTADLEDERERDVKLVVIREGQAAFREKLLSAYDGRCAITGYSVKDVLEAAHIVPYLGVKTNHPSNGLILRSDLHKLFDSFKITVNPDTLTVCVAPDLMNTEYHELDGIPLSKVQPNYPPVSRAALRHHMNQCIWFDNNGLNRHEAP